MKAVIAIGDGTVQLKDAPIPAPGEAQVLVKVEAAAMNPGDGKLLKLLAPGNAGSIVGCDFAGTIAKLGPGVEGEWKLGDRVASFVLGSFTPNGAFTEYVVAPSRLLIRIPDDWTFETAAQLGVSSFTATQTLWLSHNLPKPFDDNPSTEPITLLVWSGATSTGNYVIQYAKAAGLKAITTASAKQFDRLKTLGADEVFDYNDPVVAKNIRNATGSKLRYAVDCYSEGTSIQMVQDSLGEGGVIACINPYPENTRKDIKVNISWGQLVHDSFESPLMSHKPTAEDKEFGRWAANLTSRLIANPKFVPLPIKVWPNGLAGVSDAFAYLQSGKVSGEKIVFRIKDTPGL